MTIAASGLLVVAVVTWCGIGSVYSEVKCVKSAKKCNCSESEVDCTNVGLTQMPNKGDLPSKGAKLITLKLTGNKIKEIKSKDLNYVLLKALDLGRQEIAGPLELYNAFKHTTALKYLSFDSNELFNIDLRPLYDLIERLSMSNVNAGELRGLPQYSFASMKELTQLVLVHNRINNKSFHFTEHPKLKLLDLGFNSFKEIPSFAGSSNLANISLNNNQITKVPGGSFKGLTKLHTLSLDNNPDLSSVDKTAFDDCPNLAKLSMKGTKLTSIPAALQKLQRLSELDLSQTKIVEIDGQSFKDMSGLQTVRVADTLDLNTVKTGAFKNLPNLDNLILSGNAKLETIESGWLDVRQRPLTIDVSNCSLRALPLTSAQNLEIRAEGNQWDCGDYNNKVLAEVCNKSQCNAVCKFPASEEGKKLMDATPKPKPGPDAQSPNAHSKKAVPKGVIVAVAVAAALVVIVFIAIIYRKLSKKETSTSSINAEISRHSEAEPENQGSVTKEPKVSSKETADEGVPKSKKKDKGSVESKKAGMFSRKQSKGKAADDTPIAASSAKENPVQKIQD